MSMPSSRYVRVERRGDLELCIVDHPCGRALLTSQGAQLLAFTPAGEKPVVWLSEEAAFQSGVSVRGGIPVCAPWFGALDANPERVRAGYTGTNAPAHGLVRGVPWALEAVEEDETGVRIGFSLEAASPSLRDWSAPLAFRVEYTVGRELRAKLRVTASKAPSTVSLALHTYLAVSDIDAVEVSGFEGVPYRDALDGWREKVEASPVRFAGEVDRVYEGVARASVVHDRGWARRVMVEHENARSAVLWNPHVEKTKRLGQMAPEGWRRMLCIETANVLGDVRTLEAGETHVMGVRVAVEAGV
jgi:glucose-6-phosphate 1-epimerase